jgi:hypothetical protein
VKPNPKFLNQPKDFWAHVRSISQHFGYTDRRSQTVSVPSVQEIAAALNGLGLRSDHVVTSKNQATEFGSVLHDYFRHRAAIINRVIEPNLMDAPQAKQLYDEHIKGARPGFMIPMNKQKGDKKAPAYLTAIINLLIEKHSSGLPCVFDPRELTSVTRQRLPVRTLARRVDGAFPAVINPVAVWEIKEYYYTTTFGSRVADGVYESLLDGMELEELRTSEKIDIKHYLMIDSRYTWWECGRSYLCRILDMLHMGYVDEVLVGREVVARLPSLVREWVTLARSTPQKVELKQTSGLKV